MASKRTIKNRELVADKGLRPVMDALEVLRSMQCAKFKNGESVDVAVNLGVDVKNSEQQIRGVTILPHGNGRTVRIAVFAQGDNATAATKAGADKVGMADLAEDIKKGNLDYDVIIASPDTMPIVGKLAQILGPRGLMPNPKSGTVSANIAEAVGNAKRGQIQFRTEKGGIVHGCIGNINFKSEALKENLEALIGDLQKLKPPVSKGVYLKHITLSSTMSPGISVDQSSLNIS